MNPRNPVQRYGVAALIALMAAAMPAACGSDDGGSGQMTISVREPGPAAAVTVPFTVQIDSSVPLGDDAAGLHHVHLYFDDKVNDYLVVESGTVQVTQAPTGSHVLHVSLRNANHSAAGAEAEVTLTVNAGGTPAPSPTGGGTPGGSPSPSGYGY